MSMQAHVVEDLAPSSNPTGRPDPGIISGMRPVQPDSRPGRVSERAGAPWAPFAAVAWLLALTPAAVDAVRASFVVQMLIAMLQAGLIIGVLMRFAWAKRIHLLLIGVGALFGTLLLAMISFDRSEYRVDLERFETTLRGPTGTSD